LSEHFANVAAGVRADVSKAPMWVDDEIIKPMVKNGLV